MGVCSFFQFLLEDNELNEMHWLQHMQVFLLRLLQSLQQKVLPQKLNGK